MIQICEMSKIEGLAQSVWMARLSGAEHENAYIEMHCVFLGMAYMCQTKEGKDACEFLADFCLTKYLGETND